MCFHGSLNGHQVFCLCYLCYLSPAEISSFYRIEKTVFFARVRFLAEKTCEEY